MSNTKLVLLMLCLMVSGVHTLQAEETDQFTLPPVDLADIGPIASSRLFDVIEKVVAKTNHDIQRLRAQIPNSSQAVRQLAVRENSDYLAEEIYKKTGPGFPNWLRGVYLPQYKERKPWKTVYWLFFTQSPVSFIGLSPTINMYGHYFGADKLGHFFMQGHTYYQLYAFLTNHHKTPEQARRMMISYGQILEHTYLGTLVNGVYSNADLSANYAGWKFYQNISHPVTIGSKTLDPILILKNHQWVFAKTFAKEDLLKPYFSDNLNEALNPSHYLMMQKRLRSQVKQRCEDWVKRRSLTKDWITAKQKETTLWHGETYGHWMPQGREVSLQVCFGGT